MQNANQIANFHIISWIQNICNAIVQLKKVQLMRYQKLINLAQKKYMKVFMMF